MINVYEQDSTKVIARVNSNTNLDYWDGNNHTGGSMGRHKGLTKLQDGRFVLIHTTQWQGERDHAVIITKEEALQEVLQSGNTDLFEKYPELKELQDETLIKEA